MIRTKGEARLVCRLLVLFVLFSCTSASAQEAHIFEYTGSYQYYSEGYFLLELENFGYQVNADITITYTYNCEPAPETKNSMVNIQHAELGKTYAVVNIQPPTVPELCFGDPVLDSVGISIITATPIPQQAPNTPPVASIVFVEPPEGECPLTVTLLGGWVDDGGIGRWEWIFGDGQNSAGEGEDIAATHTYDVPGSYLVFLKVWDLWGAVGYDFVMVKAYSPKPAVVGDIGVSGMTHTCVDLLFDPLPLFEGLQDIVDGYLWDFGDGGTSSELMPTKRYVDVGTYTVSLTLTYYDGSSKTVTKVLSITANGPPVPDFTADGPAKVGSMMTFDASPSTDPEGDFLTFSWDLDGTIMEGAVVSHEFSRAATFDVTLYASDGVNTASASKTIIISQNHAPVPMFETSGNLSVGQDVTFDASASYDEDGDELSYLWDFGDGGTAEGEVVTHEFEVEGPFSVTLVVADQMSSGTYTGTVPISKEDSKVYYYILPIGAGIVGALVYLTRRGPGKLFQEVDLVKKGY